MQVKKNIASKIMSWIFSFSFLSTLASAKDVCIQFYSSGPIVDGSTIGHLNGHPIRFYINEASNTFSLSQGCFPRSILREQNELILKFGIVSGQKVSTPRLAQFLNAKGEHLCSGSIPSGANAMKPITCIRTPEQIDPNSGPLTSDEKLEHQAEKIRQERLKFDADKHAIHKKEKAKCDAEVDEARRRLKTSEKDPNFEKDFSDKSKQVKARIEELKKKRAEEKALAGKSALEKVEEFCFPAGTEVSIGRDGIAIETLTAGSMVIADDRINNLCVLAEVEAVYQHNVSDLVKIDVAESSFQVTPNHKFYVAEAEEFLPASSLLEGDQLLTLEGEKVTVSGVEQIVLETPVTVYNLRVKGYANYFAGPNQVLTHNCDGLLAGAGHALQETMAGIRDAILHPLETAESLGNTILHADKVAVQIAESVAEVLSEFPEYSASEQGALIGELTVELASLLTSGAGLKAGSRLAKLAAESKYGSKVIEAISTAAEKAGVAHERVVNNWKKSPERGSLGERTADGIKDSNSVARSNGAVFKTSKESTTKANELGFEKINERVNGQPVYRKDKEFITRDVDGHNGGAWKKANSVKDLGKKETRSGTYDANLNRIGD